MSESPVYLKRGFRLFVLLMLACLALSAALPAIAQSDDEGDSESEAETAIADAQAIDLSGIALLEFRTYEQKWVRYINADAAGNLKLAMEGINKFPFRSVSLNLRVTMENLETPSILGSIVTAEGMEYSAEAMSGNCLTEALAKHGATDILCLPGSSVMSPGHAISVLYHPDTGEIVAVTSSVDNTGGVATRLETVAPAPAPAAPAEAAPPVAPAQEQPAGDPNATTCGPWNNNQWLPANEYWSSGLTLPIDFSQTGGETPDFFICVVPGNGNAPYLRAGVDPEKPASGSGSSSGASGGSGSGGGNGGSGGGNGGNGGGNGGGDDDDNQGGGGGECDDQPGTHPIYDPVTGDFVTCGSGF